MDIPNELSDGQWEKVNRLLSNPARRRHFCDRDVLNAVLHVLRTGSSWSDLPDCYPPHHTCQRRFQQWVRAGIMRAVLQELTQPILIGDRREVVAPLAESHASRRKS